MRLVSGSNREVPATTESLVRRMLGPLTGLVQTIGFVLRDPMEPGVAVSGGEMTGVHVLRGSRPPRPGAYHIGGAGTTYAEALIKTLGETVERYSHFAALAGGLPVSVASIHMLRTTGVPAMLPNTSELYSVQQLARPDFPFVALGDDDEIGWVQATSLITGETVAVPAQQALVGYARAAGEPPFTAGVTTGSAAHTNRESALRNALLEIVQIDSAIGCWYGRQRAVHLTLDGRVALVQQAINRTLHRHGPSLRFFSMPNADLPGFSIACLVESGDIPHVAVGLGCDLRLSRAIYKAFLEGVAVAHLAKIVLFRGRVEAAAGVANAPADVFYDLDSNVGHYADGHDADVIDMCFPNQPSVVASDMDKDHYGSPSDDAVWLLGAMAATGKRLAVLDLTTPDIADLGFIALRVWSPDTLSLPLPSAPAVRHPRFGAYGGVVHERPHPLP